ncbi:MAG TPA: YraN family protein [Pyrinomonadaceae bacterium]|nr:YraN family protein [Pyrinomonadaceae bacterium]
MAHANDSSPETSSPEPSTHLAQSELGRRGEELAAAYLQQAGYRLVAANFSVPVGQNRKGAVVSVEIDLIAYDDATLCFVEVKTRASDWFAVPSVSVDLRKQRQITRGARAYRRIFGLTSARYRYDVVSIVWPPEGGVAEIELIRNFWTEEKFRKRRWQERYWD